MSAGTSHMPQLDGLRAIAVGMVAVFHWHHPRLFGQMLPLGVGVDIFFVLSGFLITGILLNVRERIGEGAAARRFALRSFWIRRFLRLLPAVVCYLAVATAMGEISDVDGMLWYLGYLGNFRIVELGYGPIGTAHLWSLAVEEQFYLIVPFVMLWVPRQWLRPFFMFGIALSAVTWLLVSPAQRYLPPTAFGALFVGCLAAMLHAEHRDSAGAMRLSLLGAPLLVTSILLQAFGPSNDLFRIGNELLLFTSAAALCWRAAAGRAGAFLETRPMRWIGRVSYAIYLWHFVAMSLTVSLLGAAAPWPFRFTVAILCTFGFAYGSDVLIEQPFVQRKVNHPYVRPQPVAAEPTPSPDARSSIPFSSLRSPS